MAQPSSLNTNNPFRRKQAGALTTSNPPISLASDAFADAFDPLPTSPSSSLDPTRPPLPSSDDFRNSLQSLGQSNEPPPKTSFQKPKVVKRVRVQSPPPSPESEEEPDTNPPVEEDTAESSSSDDQDEGADPFAQADEVPPPTLSRPELPGSSQVPPNPFGRTLEDLEHPKNEPTQNPGQAGGPAQPPRTDGASIADASSTLTAQDTPRTSHQTSEHGREEPQSQRTSISGPIRPTAQAPATSRSKAPPPPPPSSRHGKLIKVEPKGEERSGTPSTPRPSSWSSSARASRVLASPFSEQPSDVNTPLPPPPVKSPSEEDVESSFDREAAAKVPDVGQETHAPTPQPPTPPKPTTTSPPPSQASKKPPPPPRRSTHGRSENSIRSRSSSLKVASSTTQVNAPAPPPPRRSTHGSRPSTSISGLGIGITSPVAPSAGGEGTEFPGLAAQPVSGSAQGSRPSTPANSSSNNPETASISSFSQPGHGRTLSGSGKLAPPPPPARNKSVRSGAPSTPGTVRRADSGRSKEPTGLASPAPIASSPNHAPPPPPRPRPRGSNRRSVSGSGSVDSGNPAPTTGTVESPAPVESSAALASGSGGAGARFLETSLASGEEPRGLPDGELASGDVDEEDVLRRESATKDILADLDALQREVDALRAAQEQRGTTTTM
ncbi:hypothetical protein NEUTE1DRAFT_85165 [Neurospora tetrasperma FGSC 2508]|uniref:DZF domain-containing protein n=1 Tax=Neurospora tetrasperma (strain FGSC 2508 / ATCC MYA-4615 / P0657) TaxID=510951 RepID=F8MSJ2_NEUT8|nr:uncharacterized protein NEUTE1DRAFT_85165 [Neurospora tetrasperma FGSC 2508]EGO55079.1 hypothetical protein NEUTE1DRAFT_85165 [Neurospora tetrasperma FGSC 2508]EGZ69714.1 hypothetical protein NEUTE2DRAFT_116433 [Neurospora tetrasperma FGSC 2509]